MLGCLGYNAEMTKTAADYVIVGAGSAGCALAYRLGAAGCDVLLVEHGRREESVLINMPAALSYPMNMARYDWGLHSEPEPHLGGRAMACPRGKAWGGSSSINGMVFVRGHFEDYNTWARMGAAGWSYDDVLPYFMKMETAHAGDDGWRGREGPLHVTRAPRRNPLYDAFIAAGEEAGLGRTEDYNGQHPEGFCQFEQTVWKGNRFSAAKAYLLPALQRENVSILNALALRVVFASDAPQKAVGVEVMRNGQRETITARREVILSASAINSPKLLMLSGIGDPALLSPLGINVVAARRGVGQNLQDHLEAYIQQKCKQPITLNGKLGLISKGLIGAQWLFFGTGDGATNHFESGAFIRTPSASYADIQFHFLAAAIRYDGKTAAEGHGFQAHVGQMRSPSRGFVRLNSADPFAAPTIQFNYMSHDEDWQNFRFCIRTAREVFAQPAMREFSGAPIAPSGDSDEDLDAYIRAHAESAYHPCGTCKMGAADDEQAVVDSDCRVIGAECLRVVDSSIFPQIPYGNLNAPSIMVGEKAAAHILGESGTP